MTGGTVRIPRASEAVRLLEADAELGALLSPGRRANAERDLVVRTHRLSVGPWDVSRLSGASADHVGLLVLDGVISRELELAEREELVRRADGSWLLRGDPPDAQSFSRRPTAAELRGQDVLRPSRRFARDEEDVDPDQLI